MASHGAVHFEIGGPDREALFAFYRDAFGWTIDANNPMDYGIVFKMDDGIGGGIMQTPDGSPVVTFYVTCGDDVKGMLDKAVGLGATVALDVQEVPDGPTIAAFLDPQGHLVGLVNGDASDEPPAAMPAGTGSAVAWWELGCEDAAGAQAFYRDLFGWTVNADNAMNYGETKAVGNGIGGGIGPSMGQPNYVTVYIAEPDLKDALDRVAKAGGKTMTEPMTVPGGPEIAHFTDPAGNMVGLLNPSTAGGN